MDYSRSVLVKLEYCSGIPMLLAYSNIVVMSAAGLISVSVSLMEVDRMLPGYDVVIELDMQLDLKRNLRPGESVSVTFMDYRLFEH